MAEMEDWQWFQIHRTFIAKCWAWTQLERFNHHFERDKISTDGVWVGLDCDVRVSFVTGTVYIPDHPSRSLAMRGYITRTNVTHAVWTP